MQTVLFEFDPPSKYILKPRGGGGGGVLFTGV